MRTLRDNNIGFHFSTPVIHLFSDRLKIIPRNLVFDGPPGRSDQDFTDRGRMKSNQYLSLWQMKYARLS
jgi:hypothetical protein